MDFGIACPVTVSIHTLAGSVPGTVPYMAPEVCTGGDCDFRSDIYQIGLLLYECIGGVMAYPQSDLSSLIDAIKSGERKPLVTVGQSAIQKLSAPQAAAPQPAPAEEAASEQSGALPPPTASAAPRNPSSSPALASSSPSSKQAGEKELPMSILAGIIGGVGTAYNMFTNERQRGDTLKQAV